MDAKHSAKCFQIKLCQVRKGPAFLMGKSTGWQGGSGTIFLSSTLERIHINNLTYLSWFSYVWHPFLLLTRVWKGRKSFFSSLLPPFKFGSWLQLTWTAPPSMTATSPMDRLSVCDSTVLSAWQAKLAHARCSVTATKSTTYQRNGIYNWWEEQNLKILSTSYVFILLSIMIART